MGCWILLFAGDVQDLVTAEPDIFEDLLSPHDQFILLACDGLWDVFGNQEAVDFVRAALPLYRPEEVRARHDATRHDSYDLVLTCYACRVVGRVRVVSCR